ATTSSRSWVTPSKKTGCAPTSHHSTSTVPGRPSGCAAGMVTVVGDRKHWLGARIPDSVIGTDSTPSDFAQRAMREASRRGFERATRRVVLGDGAAWIWNLADEYFPNALQIVDRFHAKQHLSDVAKAVYGIGSDMATGWARQRHHELDAGEIEKIIVALALHARHCEAARKCIDYLQTNRARMRYHDFHPQALCTSTAV